MTRIIEFLESRIAEDEAASHAQTVVISGGWPALEVPNCVGPDGRGCESGWRLTAPTNSMPGWWKSADVQAIINTHERTHVTEGRKRAIAECKAKRAILVLAQRASETEHAYDDHEWQGTVESAEPLTGDAILYALAAVYRDHPDYDAEWAVE